MSGETPRAEPKVAVVLEDVNKVITQLLPVVGLGMTAVRMLAALLQKNGIDIGPFQQEITRYDAALTNADAATAEFRQKYGYAGQPLPGTPETPGDPAGPAPGQSTTIGS